MLKKISRPEGVTYGEWDPIGSSPPEIKRHFTLMPLIDFRLFAGVCALKWPRGGEGDRLPITADVMDFGTSFEKPCAGGCHVCVLTPAIAVFVFPVVANRKADEAARLEVIAVDVSRFVGVVWGELGVGRKDEVTTIRSDVRMLPQSTEFDRLGAFVFPVLWHFGSGGTPLMISPNGPELPPVLQHDASKPARRISLSLFLCHSHRGSRHWAPLPAPTRLAAG